MPRQSRIDYPGALHHIMIRGIERKNIFTTDHDKKDLLKRLASHIEEKHVVCFAFAIMSNHVHLLLQTGATPVSKVLHSVQTGYAVSYNLRHNRTGKLYQNRFKSILCDKEEYLLQLVRYIHLNPIKAGIVPDMRNLDKYPWTSHSIYMGKQKNDWFDTDEVLSHFGRTEREARKEYRSFVKSGLEIEDPIDFDGGGLIRSLGGYWEALKKTRKLSTRSSLKATRAGKRKKEAADERILGCGEFVEEVLKETEENESRQSKLAREGWDFKKVLQKAAETVGLNPDELLRSGRLNSRSNGRGLLCKWLVVDLKKTQREVSECLGLGRSAIPYLVNKGRKVERELNVEL